MKALGYENWRTNKTRGYSGIRLKKIDGTEDDFGFYDLIDAEMKDKERLKRLSSIMPKVTSDVYNAFLSTRQKEKSRDFVLYDYENSDLKRIRHQLIEKLDRESSSFGELGADLDEWIDGI
jgi:hypothetical protein